MDIVNLTGFKVNSVRGTLWQLHAGDRSIMTHKGKWYPKGSPQYVEDIGGPQFLEPDDGSERKEPSDETSDGSETGSDDDSNSSPNHSSVVELE